MCLLSCKPAYAQHQGFSKVFRYEGDTSARTDITASIAYDSMDNYLYFAIQTTSIDTKPWKHWSELIKTDINGNVITRQLDTFEGGLNSRISYDRVLLSKNRQELYWAGGVYEASDSATQDFVITKTDNNLNIIWQKRIVNEGIRAGAIGTILENEEGGVTFLANKSTPQGDRYPFNLSKIYLTKLDTAGNIVWDKTADQNNNYIPTSMVKTNNNNYIISGITPGSIISRAKASTVKVDTAGNKIWSEIDDRSVFFSVLLNLKK